MEIPPLAAESARDSRPPKDLPHAVADSLDAALDGHRLLAAGRIEDALRTLLLTTRVSPLPMSSEQTPTKQGRATLASQAAYRRPFG
jgi:hypothetical protein